VDEFGFDRDLTLHVLAPPFRPLYEKWFRVEASGLHNVPSTGGALVVANHSGTLPLDAVMTALALLDHHPAHRHLRMLGADLVFRTPGLGPLARKSGRRWPATRTPSGCWRWGSWSGSGRRGSRASASRTGTATSCSGSAAAGSSGRRCGRGCRSSRARSSAPRRSTR
jgi:hypothetical protein